MDTEEDQMGPGPQHILRLMDTEQVFKPLDGFYRYWEVGELAEMLELSLISCQGLCTETSVNTGINLGMHPVISGLVSLCHADKNVFSLVFQ